MFSKGYRTVLNWVEKKIIHLQAVVIKQAAVYYIKFTNYGIDQESIDCK